NTSSVHKF
ncbi:hypothetical protein D018_3827B, partial [Vibrio parahaemolyticus VP2007-007]